MNGVNNALIVGCGSIGTRHASNLQSLGINVVGYDKDQERREEIADSLDIKTVSGLDVALANHPDMTVVAVPNRFHVPVAKQAAKSGSHLFIEKPLSHTEEDISELVATSQSQNLTTMVGCNLRFHPCLKQFKTLIQNNTVGDPVTARIEAGSYLPEWHPNEDYRELYSAREDLGGGVILDFIHEINYARWFFGEVKAVTALTRAGTTLDIETEEVATISLEFDSGFIGQLLLDYIQRPYRRSCRLVGSKGTLKWSWSDEAIQHYNPEIGKWQQSATCGDWSVNEMYFEEMRHFIDCVSRDAQTMCPLREGWRDLRIALAAKRAAETGEHQRIEKVQV